MMTPEWLAEAKAKYMALLEGPKWKLLWDQWATVCTVCDHQDCADGRLFYAEVERLAAENADVKSKLMISEEYRRAYQTGKSALYAMGGQVCEAAMTHLPCGEGSIDRYGDRIEHEYSPRLLAQRNVLAAENAELRKDAARIEWLDQQIVDVIYLDDGRFIDVKGNPLRPAIDAAMQSAAGEKP